MDRSFKGHRNRKRDKGLGKRKKRKVGRPVVSRHLIVGAEMRETPDWDSYIASLIALSLKRVEEKRDK